MKTNINKGVLFGGVVGILIVLIFILTASITMSDMKRTSISLPGGDKWEKVYGFSRAKVIENPALNYKQVFISNTSAFDSMGEINRPGDVGKQVEQIIINMKMVLEQAGGDLNDVVETTFYTTRFDFFPEIAEVHQKYFGEVQPATTLIHVSEMASSEMLVEGSARAIISR